MPRVLESKHMIPQVKYQEHLQDAFSLVVTKSACQPLTLKVPRVTNIKFLLTISMVVAKTKTRKRRTGNEDPQPTPLFFLFYFIRTPIRRRFNAALYFLIIASICPSLLCCPHSIHH